MLGLGKFIVKNSEKKKKIISNISKKTINEIPDFYIASPLTQSELALGWKLKLPKKKSNDPIHHFTINLLQLPKYLWKKVKYNYYDYLIKDNIYEYSILKTEYDELIFDLYNHLFNKNKLDINIINELYNLLINSNLKGWLLEYTKNIIDNYCL